MQGVFGGAVGSADAVDVLVVHWFCMGCLRRDA